MASEKQLETIPQRQVIRQEGAVLYGAPEGHDARILAEKARILSHESRALIHVAMDDARMAALSEFLSFFAPDIRVLSFPAWDCLPYDRVSPHGGIMSARVSALSQMMTWSVERERYPRLILTSVNAILQRVMPRSALSGASFEAKVGERVDLDHLQMFLAQNGYHRTETVREAGEFAVRGGIVDLFPSGFENPVRMDLFGDELESIKSFDPVTQVSIAGGSIKHIALRPACEFFLDEASIARFRSAYRSAFGVVQSNDPLYEAVSAGRAYNGAEHWLPLFHDKMETLFDYVPQAGVTFDAHISDSVAARFDQIKDFYEARKTMRESALKKARKNIAGEISGTVYNPLPPTSLYISEEWKNFTVEAQELSPFGAPPSYEGADQGGRKGRDFSDIRALPDGDVFGALRVHLSVMLSRKIFIAAYSEGSKERLKGLMQAAHIVNIVDCATYQEIKNLKTGQIGIGVLGLEHGFESADLVVLTEADILGDRLTRKSKKRRKADHFLTEVSALSEGDLVVHIDHGIGRFLALETLKAAGTVYDCLKIEYAGGDKLYVPVINLEVLSRFGSDEGTVQLDKLGGAGWQARKAKAKKNLMEIADKLLGIAAARQLKKAPHLQVTPEMYNEFAARFPYAETEDQERSIESVLAGLAGDYPMDHLVCGDVGFGKTEVAMRAAYVAAMSGVQVAIVVPTTILARQHYAGFMKRFAGLGIEIGQLSRLAHPKDVKRTREGLADGSVQIVIGTHALFAEKLKFNNLGLVIVDEEQRFGVKQKEKLKELQNDVHVLTLTATPIPRTLQMSLAGVKEMSLITTPPVDRLAIRTFVMPIDEVVIRDALMREHYRGGQSFYVVPRISDLQEIEEMLRELVPELKFIAAHGQLSANDLEDRMDAFYDRQYDILLATNIIESGIDIPTANTMIVHRADMFGLGQLYQIRGRIGRSKMRAYAYLTYQPAVKLNPQAQKRLEVMETLDTLGSGFQLASHDMDIRGAGNLLGDQQSGHIREIGVELYQQMLEEAVAAARSGAKDDFVLPEEGFSPQINLGASVLIPEGYVADLSVRMSLYRRLSDLEDQGDIEGFAAELIDRFGPLPEEVENLLQIVAIKNLSKKAGVSKLEAGPKGAVIEFYKNAPPNVEGLMRWMVEQRGTVKLRPDQKVSIVRIWDKPAQRIKGALSLMRELAGLC